MIEVRNTSIIISPYKIGDLPVIEDMYTAVDNHSKEEFPCGYFIDENMLYLPRGTSISKLEDLTGEIATYNKHSDEYDYMSRQHITYYDPRNEDQRESIAFLVGRDEYEDTKDAHQKAFSMATGGGKTFCSVYAITELNIKTLIITHQSEIKAQWIKTLKNMFDYHPSEYLDISGSDIMEDIMDGKIEPKDVYLVNHQTLHSYLFKHNPYMLHQFFKKLHIGIKIYDEAHLEFMNILMMDSFSNIDKTWYVTATFGRSDKTEDRCYRRAFSNVISFGSHIQAKKRKHVVYHQCAVYSMISWKDLRKVNSYAGMTANTYAKYAFETDKNETVYKAICKIFDMVKDTRGKKLIFVGLISAVDEIVDKLKRDYPEYRDQFAAYHSKISKSDKIDIEQNKNVIVTTIKSCGTGKDIPGLRVLINCEAFASKLMAQQLMGRLREIDEDTLTYMFDIYIADIPAATWWFKSRIKKFTELAKEIIYLDLNK